ncbi:uncharacterized protein LOC130821377 isoform X2 [Amaranthus tricolor]|uniref:uncharacterized protein LOC130821377 isoform X2 n=1 Tax=Amaranthus tricolor TaxID=29722 RepID=UPI0025881362|nr:uncharacterized protein LOC130821377 isoform X2 [Amaranthus tricolor]
MGTKLQIENCLPAHYSMNDLNRGSNGASWPYFGESNLSDGQFYFGFLPRTVADSHPEYEQDVVKQTMLEHEAVFKIQVNELHRLYSVQRDLMDEVIRKEQFKRRIPNETCSSSSHVPSQMQREDMQRWKCPNLPVSNSACGTPPLSILDTVQSSSCSAKGKSIQTDPTSFPNCYSPKNLESECRPTKHRRRMLDLDLPADEYIDTDEVVQVNDVKDSDYMSLSTDKNGNFAYGNGKLFMGQGDASKSDLHDSQPRALADLNDPVNVEEETSVSVDFLHRGGCHHDANYRDISTRFLSPTKDVNQNLKNGSTNGALNDVHFENRVMGSDWFSNALKSESNGCMRSINHDTGPEKISALTQPVQFLLDQATKPPAFLDCDRINGEPWKAKSGSIIEKSDRGLTLSSSNVLGAVASHLPKQTDIFNPSDFSKSWDQSASSCGKPGSFFGHKPISVQTSPYLSSAITSKSPQSSCQGNGFFGNNKWNLNSSPSALGTEMPARKDIHEGSSSSFIGFDYVNSNYSDRKALCSGINFFDATSYTDGNPVKDMNLNVTPSNGLSDDHIGEHHVIIIDNDKKSDPLAILPWLRGKGSCSKEAENSRKGFNSLESACEVGVKAEIPDYSKKILGVPIFENPPKPKKEVSNTLISHNCSGNKEGGSVGRKRGFDINLNCDVTEEDMVLEEKTQIVSDNRRHRFDLNSCIIDEEYSCETCDLFAEKGTCIRVGTGIDLEAPIIIENEDVIANPRDEDSFIKDPEKMLEFPKHDDDEETELATSVAAAIVSLSSCVNLSQPKEATCLDEETDLDNPLHWFVDIACSNNGNDVEFTDYWLSDGLDDFELMILRQKECNEDEYFPKSSFPEVPNVEEKGVCALTTTRTRKGHGRRGRQKRDFQRDILPGLTSLSRHEVTEDLQVFGGLMRATGHTWHSAPNRKNASRNGCGRGRRRSVSAAAAAAPAPLNTVCALPLTQQPHQLLSNNTEGVLEDQNLTGWGKTRRPRRQRYPTGNRTPPPVPLT